MKSKSDFCRNRNIEHLSFASGWKWLRRLSNDISELHFSSPMRCGIKKGACVWKSFWCLYSLDLFGYLSFCFIFFFIYLYFRVFYSICCFCRTYIYAICVSVSVCGLCAHGLNQQHLIAWRFNLAFPQRIGPAETEAARWFHKWNEHRRMTYRWHMNMILF